MVRSRRSGVSLSELMLALIILGSVLAPVLGTMRRQITDTRWSNERMMAVQLANEALEYYQAIGYQGLHSALVSLVPPVPPDGLPVNGFLVYDSYVGTTPLTLFPAVASLPPNAVNPCLGGPGDINQPNFLKPADLATPVTPGMPGSEVEETLKFFNFRRRVEIFGGNAPPPPWPPGFFKPFPGLTRPMDCYLIRVTIDTTSGTMVKPTDQYQAVTVIARH